MLMKFGTPPSVPTAGFSEMVPPHGFAQHRPRTRTMLAAISRIPQAESASGLTPLVGLPSRRVTDTLDIRRMTGIQLSRPINGLCLGGFHCARSLRVLLPDSVIALRALFDVQMFITHCDSKIPKKRLSANGRTVCGGPPIRTSRPKYRQTASALAGFRRAWAAWSLAAQMLPLPLNATHLEAASA